MSPKTIVIAEDERDFLTLLAVRCQQLGHRVQTAQDGHKALSLIREKNPQLILLDIDMPGRDGLSVCREIRKDQRLRSIPVIVLSGRSDPNVIQECEQLGVRYFNKRPNIWDDLKKAICELLTIESSLPKPLNHGRKCLQVHGTVVCIDDDPAITRALQLRLREYGIDTYRAEQGMEGFDLIVKHSPSAIITDFSMPDVLGTHVIEKLNESSIEIPVIVLSGAISDTSSWLHQHLTNLGAVAVLQKPVDFELVLSELKKHISLPADIEQSRVDGVAEVGS
jgi:CheY-like chemotaxis protein